MGCNNPRSKTQDDERFLHTFTHLVKLLRSAKLEKRNLSREGERRCRGRNSRKVHSGNSTQLRKMDIMDDLPITRGDFP